MRLNEGLLVRTRLDEENAIFIEKVIEGFCHYLPIFNEISFLVPEKNSERFIIISSIFLTENGELEVNEGEFIELEECTIIKAVLESCKGTIIDGAGESGGTIYLPISKNRRIPFGLVRINCKSDMDFDENYFLDYIKNYDLMDEIYNKCFSKFINDAYYYISRSGKVESLNLVAEEFKRRIRVSDEAWLVRLWESKESSLPVEEIIEELICTGMDFEINGFQFFIIFFPLFIGNEHRGMLVSISDVSIIKNMLKEVINKSTVIKEVHHRVKNNLQTVASLLRLQTRRSNSFMVEKAFVESINRISSIALVYEALSKEGTNVVNMKDCIKNIMSMILTNMVEPNKVIKGEIRGKDIYLSSSQASNVSLCITELLQNAMKHAFILRKKGNIIVTLDQVNREVIIMIEDDGVGLSGKKTKGNSLGLKIIQMITTETLKGNFKLESHTYGSIAEIRFPI